MDNNALKSTISPEAQRSATKGGAWGRIKDVMGQWFGPLDPLPAVAPKEVAGRQYDYPTAVNIWQNPRQQEKVSFEQLRAIADNLDILRLVIETRKDLVCGLKFEIVPKEPYAEPDARCKKIQACLALPDGENPWNDWLRMLLEDLFVIDAPCVYPRKTIGGDLYALEPVDGATITRKIDQGGRTPLPPEIAYQQVLKGLPAVNYTRDELIYKPRNKRTNKLYGYSPVEQILMTVNIALRRQLSQLQFYTEGTTPDSIYSVPADWNPDQIREFKEYWNETLEGNTAERRKAQFIPGGVTAINTKEGLIKDEYDEWIARIVCYAFSVPANAFIKQQNRATAQTSLDQAVSEGLMPILDWVASLVEVIIIKCFGCTDLQLKWIDSKDPDMAQEATIKLQNAQADQIDINTGVLDINEARINRGLDSLSPAEIEKRKPAPPPQLAACATDNGAKPAPDEKQKPDATIKEPAQKLGKSTDGSAKNREKAPVNLPGIDALQKKKARLHSHPLTVTGPRY